MCLCVGGGRGRVSRRLNNIKCHYLRKWRVYLLPNEATEQDRLEVKHAAWAPIYDKPLKNVLDIGTGTGIWALEFAEVHPQASVIGTSVIGTDLSQIQPQGKNPRVEWVPEDAEDEWAFAPSLRFDYIHLRTMVTCFKDHRAPGGWVEYQEGGVDIWCEDQSTLGTALHKWTFLMKAGAMALGKLWLTEAGFVNVAEKIIRMLGNPWPDDPRLKAQGACLSLRILGRGLGMEIKDIEDLIIQVRADVSNRNLHFYWTGRIVYGQRPL
ncbi:S-adenosyl-L-methionine-dependent methyltransferase [Xylariales sp. PMI_506]|nr:S-adenosyl-L-methionine-dependent methyltransferase [Xylariales sp. PMI_506]